MVSQGAEKSEATTEILSWRQGDTYNGIKQCCWSVTAKAGVGKAHWWWKQGLVHDEDVKVKGVERGLGVRNELKQLYTSKN